ncbi:MFS transporter [Adlercreutzia sp. R21]|uniref:MFS transporter n=1 Tax=Adlercreutzia wanghongyangiae TaxID=3111451 RepID=UPI002DBDDC00|nr:MFS transporter [Adlercreutzia sp. R21]MEC4185251.1 MFS transporter [Adlercreutzia sp. R21]
MTERKRVDAMHCTRGAWRAFVGCCMLCATTFGLPLLCFGVFVSPLVAQFDSSVTEVNLYYTLMTGSAVVSCAVGERLLVRAMRPTVLVGAALMGAVYGALAIVPTVPMVWLAGLVAGLCYPLCSSVLTPILINQWFVERQGTYIGIAFAVVGVAGVVVSPLLTQLILTFGWQVALGVMAGLVAAGGVLSAAIIRPHMSCENAGQPARKASASAEAPIAGAKESLRRFPVYTPVALACLLCGFVGIMNTQINAISQQSGFDAMEAATALSCMSVGLLAGKIGLGVVKDAKDGVFAITVGVIVGVVGFALMIAGLMGAGVAWFFAGAALAGFTTCLGTIAPALLMGETFPTRLYGRAVAMGSAFINAGMAVSAFFYSMVFDLAGSYVPVVCACIGGAAFIVALCHRALRLNHA